MTCIIPWYVSLLFWWLLLEVMIFIVLLKLSVILMMWYIVYFWPIMWPYIVRKVLCVCVIVIDIYSYSIIIVACSIGLTDIHCVIDTVFDWWLKFLLLFSDISLCYSVLFIRSIVDIIVCGIVCGIVIQILTMIFHCQYLMTIIYCDLLAIVVLYDIVCVCYWWLDVIIHCLFNTVEAIVGRIILMYVLCVHCGSICGYCVMQWLY